MKVFKLISIGLFLFLGMQAKAQVAVTVNVFSSPQISHARYIAEPQYYYLPEVEAFYDVSTHLYIYNVNGIWVNRAYLPVRYKNYNYNNGYKVRMHGYKGNAPYSHYGEYKMKYGKDYRGEPQKRFNGNPGKGNYNNYAKPGNNNYKEPNKGNNNAPKGNYNNNPNKGNKKSNGPTKYQSPGKNNGQNTNQGHGAGNGKKK